MSFPTCPIPPKKCQKNVGRAKKKSKKMSKKCPEEKNILKTFFGHFLSSKMGRGVLRLRAVRAGTHFRSQKCPKNVFNFFLFSGTFFWHFLGFFSGPPDIFLTFFWRDWKYWKWHFLYIFLEYLDLYNLTGSKHLKARGQKCNKPIPGQA